MSVNGYTFCTAEIYEKICNIRDLSSEEKSKMKQDVIQVSKILVFKT